MVKYETNIVIFNLCFTKLALALVLSFQEGGKQFSGHNSKNKVFWNGSLNQKKELNQKAYLQQKVLPGRVAWESIYKLHTGKHYKKQQLTRLLGWKLTEHHLKPVVTEQVSLVFGKLFRSILKIFNSDNTYSGFKYLQQKYH